jgi:serine/threonine protein kinase/Tol biopolymer transport system component
MPDPHWENLKEVFHAALALAPEQRAAYLDRAANGDASLRLAVESLLKSHEETENFVDAPAYQAAAEMLVDGDDLKAGRNIAHYRIVQLLGEGGMGQVYLAEDGKLHRRVSLKFLSTSFMKDHERRRRFEQEARAASALNHPNILTIHEISEVEGRRYIATEFIEGKTLRERLQSGIDIDDALDIAIQIASALVAAHRVNIVHRDIKPENIMIRRDDGLVKVLDFGLAKMSAPGSAKAEVNSEAETRRHANTAPGVVMGTLAYMSPEQARGDAVDERTDIWSLGVVLYEMVAGCSPFVAGTSNEIISGILSKEPPPPLTRYSRDVPERLAEIVEKALTKNREERYQTSQDLLIDLKRLRQSRELKAGMERSSPREQSGLPTSQGPTGEATSSRPEGGTPTVPSTSSAEYLIGEIRRHKRGVVIVSALGLVALTATIFGSIMFMNRYKPIQGRLLGPSPAMRITRLTDTGKATTAAISPDGNYVVYVREEEGKLGLWLRQVGSATEREIVPPMDGQIVGTTFSRDGSLIYYTASAFASPGVLYQVPTLGGTSRKVLENISGPVGLSRDGKRLAFIRSVEGAHHVDSLIVANVDGTGEQVLARKESPAYFDNGPTWSPDGKTVVCGAAVEPDFQFESFVVIPVDGEQERWMTSHRWSHVSRTVWLGDGSGLMVLALENRTTELQLWHISYPGGEVQRVTNDLNGYLADSLSITADSSALVAAQEDRSSKIWVAPTGEGEDRAKQLTDGKFDGLNGVAWTPDGKILCVLKTGDDYNIWLMNRDGTERKQLTADSYEKRLPKMSPDGRYIVFSSLHGESINIWKMDADGSNQKQLTRGAFGELCTGFTPDGKWVLFWSWTESGSAMISKVSIEGGEPVQLTDYWTIWPTISPDGKLIAAGYLDEQQGHHLAIIPSLGGQPIKLLPLPSSMSPAFPFGWTPDSSSLVYAQKHNGVANIWGQPINGDPPRQLTNFKSDLIFGFALSADGRQFVLARGTQTRDVVLIRDFH